MENLSFESENESKLVADRIALSKYQLRKKLDYKVLDICQRFKELLEKWFHLRFQIYTLGMR